MELVDVLALITALWLASSAIALVALAALYIAERTGRPGGDGETILAVPSGVTT